jgi:hypothetical protein
LKLFEVGEKGRRENNGGDESNWGIIHIKMEMSPCLTIIY